jgi:hypothetical protein
MISQIFGLLIPLAQLFFLFKMSRNIDLLAEDVQKKDELTKNLKAFREAILEQK